MLDGDTVVGGYNRNYSVLRTFEPFRQGDRDFALISTHFTATAVMDLRTGAVIAAEEPAAGGFCPVGFYVPDWWDVHDGSRLPGSLHWNPADDEWPARDGVIRRDDRFGYVKLATDTKLEPQDFIRCSSYEGERRVEFYVERGFGLATGVPIPDEDW